MKEEYEFARFDDLVCANRPPFWDVRMPLKERTEQIQIVRDELKKEYEAALKSKDFGDIDTGVLWGAFSLVDSLIVGGPAGDSTSSPRLQDLLRGNPLWDISLPESDRLKQIRRAQDGITQEWREHLDDDGASHLHTGMLLGAVNLIEDLFKGAGIPVIDDEE